MRFRSPDTVFMGGMGLALFLFVGLSFVSIGTGPRTEGAEAAIAPAVVSGSREAGQERREGHGVNRLDLTCHDGERQPETWSEDNS